MSSMLDTPVPTNARQAVELAPLRGDPEQMAEAMRRADELADGAPLTAEQVKAAVAQQVPERVSGMPDSTEAEPEAGTDDVPGQQSWTFLCVLLNLDTIVGWADRLDPLDRSVLTPALTAQVVEAVERWLEKVPRLHALRDELRVRLGPPEDGST